MPWFFIGDNISTIPPQKQKKMENLLETKSRSDIIEYGEFSDFGVYMVDNKTGGWVCVFNHRQTLTDHAQSTHTNHKKGCCCDISLLKLTDGQFENVKIKD